VGNLVFGGKGRGITLRRGFFCPRLLDTILVGSGHMTVNRREGGAVKIIREKLTGTYTLKGMNFNDCSRRFQGAADVHRTIAPPRKTSEERGIEMPPGGHR